MALQKDTVQLAFKGLQTGVDPKALATELMRLENGRMDRVGAITKRCGTTSITNAGYTEPFLSKYRDRPVLIGNGSMRVFDGAAGASSGNFDAAATPYFADIVIDLLSSVKRSLYFYPDIALLGNVLIIAYSEYKDVSGTMKYVQTAVTYDVTTGLKLDEQALQNGSVTTPHYPRIGQSTLGYVWYINSSDKLAYHGVSSSGAISDTADWTESTVTAHTTLHSLDVCNLGDANNTQLIALMDPYANIWLKTFDGTHVATTYINIGIFLTRVGLFKLAANLAVVFFQASSTPPTLYAIGADAALVSPPFSLTTVASVATNYSTSVLTGVATSTSRAVLYWTEERWNGAPGYDPYTKTAALAVSGGAGSVSGVAEFAHRAKLASKAFNAADPHVLLHYRGTAATGGTEPAAQAAQSAYFLARGAGEIVGKALVGRGGPGNPWNELPFGGLSSVVASGSSYLTGALVFTGVDEHQWRGSGKKCERFLDVGFARLTMTVGAPAVLKTLEAGNLLLIPNSNPYAWDGQKLTEQGFLQYPEGLVLSHSAGGGLLGTGQYGWVYLYEVMDAQGQTHRSCPSPMITYTPPAGEKVTLKAPTLTLTRKTGVKVILYRTESAGSILYRAADADNVATADYVTFTDATAGVADSALVGKARLVWNGIAYTPNAEVENMQPQPHSVQCLHQSRLFYVDDEAPRTSIRYSRYLLDGEGPGWNDNFVVTVPDEGGDISALASFQDRLVIFKEAMVWCCYGTGRAESGAGQDYSEPMLACTGFGCVNQKTLLALPDGLAFLGARGLLVMKPDFSVSPEFGFPVKYHTDTLTLSAAALISDLEYAIWTTTAGLALVYHYRLGQWSTFTYHESTDAVECNGVLYRKYSPTSVRVENRSTFLDGSGAQALKLVTGWIPVNGGAEGRLYRVHLVGQNISPHKLVCWPRFDLDPVWATADKATFNANTFGSAFDFSAYYGGGLASSYASKGYELVAGPRRQKCRVVQLEIFDETHDGSTPPAEAYSITQLALVVGRRPPRMRREPAREIR